MEDAVVKLTPRQERQEHQQAILATIPEPEYKRVLSRQMVLPETGANVYEGHSEARVHMYATTWSPCIAGTVALIKRRGSQNYVIVDGRHRFLAVKELKISFHFHALVYHDLTEEQEAALFWQFNEQRRNPTAEEKHRAAALTGDPLASTVNEVLRRHGISHKRVPIGAVENVVTRAPDLAAGDEALDFVLRALTDCFPTDEKRYDAILIRGFAAFWRWYGDDERVDYDELVDRIRARGHVAAQLKAEAVGQARTSGQGADNKVAELIVKAWNRKGGYRLTVK